MQSSSLPVDRRARRAKTDVIDVEMLLRTLMAWLRGEPRVCSMVPVPSEADEEARRRHREREDLIGARRSLLNKIDGILATLGIAGYRALRRDRRAQLADLRQPDGAPLPLAALARIERLLDRLELVMTQIKGVEKARDVMVAKPAAENDNERDEFATAGVRGVGIESATLLVREAFCRDFANRRSLGAYAGLVGTPFASGGMQREQGISKDGNRRLRALVVELAWFWLRFQPDSARAKWFRERVSQARGRVCKIMIVALARKLLIALALRQGWRHSGGGDDESIRTTFIATSLLVKDRRSPSIPQDPEQGAVSQSGAAARNSFSRIPGSWFGIANPTGYEVGEESLAATNWSSLATRNEEQFRCLTTKPPYEGNRI